jgi:hypothetical protein
MENEKPQILQIPTSVGTSKVPKQVLISNKLLPKKEI